MRAGNFAHGCQQRKSALAVANGFVSNSGDLGLEELVGEIGNWREMQIREEDEAFAEIGVLLFDGLFDLDDRFGLTPDVAAIADDLGSSVLVVVISEAGELAGMSLDEYLVPGFSEGSNAGGSDTDARFIVFDLFGNADDHKWVLMQYFGSSFSPVASINRLWCRDRGFVGGGLCGS